MNHTSEQAKSLWFSFEHRSAPEYFSRNPQLLSFENIVLIILHMVKKAVAVEVISFFRKLTEHVKAPSRQAFAAARDKISYTAFKDFAEKSFELALTAEDTRKYEGYRIFAFDGTSFFVGDLEDESLKEYFGESTTVQGKAMCRIGAAVDVLNECIVSASVSGFQVGERALAIEQIKALKGVKDIINLFDRGYWSPSLVREIHANGQKFLMRLASNAGKTIVTDDNGKVIKLRRYSFVLPSGELETLLTNLSAEEMTDEQLRWLYAKRWGVETKYLELKSRLEIDSFSGQSANTVLQDIYATLYISNLVAFLSYEADLIIEEKTSLKDNKYAQKTNRSNCLSLLRDEFINIILLPTPFLRSFALKYFVKDISANVTYIGKSKSRPRDKRKIKAARARARAKPVL